MQSWRYEATSKALLVGTKELLDCDGCAAGHAPHLWHADKEFGSNQQWDLTAAGQIKSTQHDTCLGVSSHLGGLSSRGGAGAVVMEACSSGTTRWKRDLTTGAITLVSPSRHSPSREKSSALPEKEPMCLAVVSDAKTASFTPDANGDHYFYLDMCHGFGCGFNQEVFLAITSKTSGKTQVIQEWDKVGTAA